MSPKLHDNSGGELFTAHWVGVDHLIGCELMEAQTMKGRSELERRVRLMKWNMTRGSKWGKPKINIRPGAAGERGGGLVVAVQVATRKSCKLSLATACAFMQLVRFVCAFPSLACAERTQTVCARTNCWWAGRPPLLTHESTKAGTGVSTSEWRAKCTRPLGRLLGRPLVVCCARFC